MDRETDPMNDIDVVWTRIEQNAGGVFETATGLEYSYRVPGQFLRVFRDGREINRSLSPTNSSKALQAMPAEKPSDIKDRQGSAHTWTILMDPRIRRSDW
jgi:hypothetical protein